MGSLTLSLTREDELALDLGDGRTVTIRAVPRKSGFEGGKAQTSITVVAPESVQIAHRKGVAVTPDEAARRRGWRIDNRKGSDDARG